LKAEFEIISHLDLKGDFGDTSADWDIEQGLEDLACPFSMNISFILHHEMLRSNLGRFTRSDMRKEIGFNLKMSLDRRRLKRSLIRLGEE
jgi:hypothetical protein